MSGLYILESVYESQISLMFATILFTFGYELIYLHYSQKDDCLSEKKILETQSKFRRRFREHDKQISQSPNQNKHLYFQN
jgi:hypothetical protein